MSYLCKSNPEESGMQIIQQNLITLAHKSNHHKPHLLQSKKTLYSTSYDIIYDTLSEFKLSYKHTFHCKFVEPRHDKSLGGCRYYYMDPVNFHYIRLSCLNGLHVLISRLCLSLRIDLIHQFLQKGAWSFNIKFIYACSFNIS